MYSHYDLEKVLDQNFLKFWNEGKLQV